MMSKLDEFGMWPPSTPVLRDVGGIVFYTAIYGDYDLPRDCPFPDEPGVTRIVFTDDPNIPTGVGWQRHIVPDVIDPAKESRLVKLLPHVVFPNARWTVWLDGRGMFNRPIADLVQYCRLRGWRLAFRKHPRRTHDLRPGCVFRALSYISLRFPHYRRLIGRQYARYMQAGMPHEAGFYAGGYIVRRNAPDTNAFMEAWCAEYLRNCPRDQPALAYVAWKSGRQMHVLTDRATQVDWARCHKHEDRT